VIYLILKIFFYLFVALALGSAGGWLARNLVAARREDELQKAVTEARARVPQFESLMRARDQQVQRLKDDNKDKDQRIAELTSQAHTLEESLRGKQRELARAASRNEALELDGASGVASTDGSMESPGRPGDLERLTEELARARRETADAVAEAAAAEAELARLRRDAGGRNAGGETTVDGAALERIKELEARLEQTADEHERLNRTLETERRRIAQLERERELQNRSLRVLHEQLEVERERNAAEQQDSAASPRRAAPL
jgi:chromosome segregation protein